MNKLESLYAKIDQAKAKIAKEQSKLGKLERQRALLERDLILKAAENHSARDVIALLTPEKPEDTNADCYENAAEEDSMQTEEQE